MTDDTMGWEELAAEPTLDLITYMQWGNQPEHRVLAEDAFIAFCLRFRDSIQQTCRIIAEKRGFDDKVADKIAEEVFEKFRKYPKYNNSKCKHGKIEKCVELYLYRIAERGLLDYVDGLTSPFSGEEEIVTEFPDIEEMDFTPERKAILLKEQEIIEKALARLTPKHKIVYLTYKRYEFDLNGGAHYLPHAFLRRLQAHLGGISQASIRVYKKQAFDKIKEYLDIYGAK